jgi:4-amino-4-deoxy-L-arabinose transferase-like glycosyltransferase
MSSQRAVANKNASRLLPAEQPTARAGWLARLGTLALFGLVALAALLPRVLDLHLFLDSDEINFWVERSYQFQRALLAGDYAATAISTHPGVTTMWLGYAGITLHEQLFAWGLLHDSPFPLYLTLLRLPVALVHTAGVVLGYALLRRLLPGAVALLAALLWAADPFVIAYQRILHVDGLTTTGATLCVLAALVFWQQQRPAVGYLLLSAVCGALAVLSKSPGLVVLPVVALGFLGSWVSGIGYRVSGIGYRVSGIGYALLWGAVFALTIVLVWPAVWADPLRVYTLLRVGVEVEGGSPHVIGNFFLGQATDTPGPLFYPVALALRTTPLTLAGLLLLPLAWWYIGRHSEQQGGLLARDPARTRRALVLLVIFVLLFMLGMSLFPKKLNRYLVPVFPALDVLAAVGLAGGAAWLAQWARGSARLVWHALLGGAALLALLHAAWWHPYGVVAFNPLLGGTPTAARTFLLGDGEGLGAAARWLNQQPDITGVTVASTMFHSLQPFLREDAQAVLPDERRLPDNAGYALIYIRHTQRGLLRPPFDQFYPQQTPLHVVRLHGVDYVWIYQVPPPIAQQLSVPFAPGITLTGYALEQDDTALRLAVQWRADARLPADYLLFAHLYDSRGQRVAQIDLPPSGPDAPTSTWQPGRYYGWQNPLPAPADLPPGDYWLALGLYTPDDLQRLPLRAAPTHPPGAPDAGPHALLLPVTLTAE